jgi:hypothetical protein
LSDRREGVLIRVDLTERTTVGGEFPPGR